MTQSLTALPLPQFKGVNAMRDALIVRERAKGTTIAATATIAECSTRTVERVQAEKRDIIESKRMQYAERFLTEFDGDDGVLVGMIKTAKDSTNRNQVGAFKELSEKLCGWGNRGNITVNGDVNTTNVDLGNHQHVHLSSEEADELSKLRERFGVN